jgi:hypothetical protein
MNSSTVDADGCEDRGLALVNTLMRETEKIAQNTTRQRNARIGMILFVGARRLAKL